MPATIPGNLIRVLQQPGLTSNQLLQVLGIQGQNSPLLQLFRQQYQKAERVGNCWNAIGNAFGFSPNSTQASANPIAYNAQIPVISACQNFTQQTGLSQADYGLMVTYWRYQRTNQPVVGETAAQATARQQARANYLLAMNNPNANHMGLNWSKETLNAWQTKSIMSDAQVQAALLGIFNNQNNYDALSDQVLWRESTYMNLKWPNNNELQLARSFAYYHNAGRRMSAPSGAYVTSFANHWTTFANQMVPALVPCFSLDPSRSPPAIP